MRRGYPSKGPADQHSARDGSAVRSAELAPMLATRERYITQAQQPALLGAWLLRRYVTADGSSCDAPETTHILGRIKIALPKISGCTCSYARKLCIIG